MQTPAPEQTVADAPTGNWVDRFAPGWLKPYARLARWDRPIGFWLLFWPCGYALGLAAVAAGGGFNWLALGLCLAGAVAMRGAGCTFNDVVDTDIDMKVARTRSRPIPSGQVSRVQALVFLVLAGEFASFTTPMLVMTTVPLAAAGGIIALWMTGQSLNAVSLIGLVVMVGMADNEAVVKLDAIQRFREKGFSIEESVKRGGRQRLRAITMTLLTTITGVLPLVFGWGSGGELYQPLAAGIIGGSVSALLVTFFLLPTAYAVVERRKEMPRLRLHPTGDILEDRAPRRGNAQRAAGQEHDLRLHNLPPGANRETRRRS